MMCSNGTVEATSARRCGLRAAKSTSLIAISSLWLTSLAVIAQSSTPVLFEEADVGFDRELPRMQGDWSDEQKFAVGVAAGDYDNDGDIDLYVVGSDTQRNHLYENDGNGQFTEVGQELGVNVIHRGSGPAFGDIDGDGDLDLFVGSIDQNPVFLFENRVNEAEGKFVDITETSGLNDQPRNTVTALFYDYNTDGLMDLVCSHWGVSFQYGRETFTLWRNQGNRTFIASGLETEVATQLVSRSHFDWSFTPGFTDIDDDGDADFLLVSDFGETQLFRNEGDGTYTNITDRDEITDQAGMGTAIADFDNDGDMDWFVTSIYDEDFGGDYFGNRMYLNDGDGNFTDVSESANIIDGDWGWGACAFDFDHDGFQDIFHVTGWSRSPTGKDHTISLPRFFYNEGSGENLSFYLFNTEFGIENRGQGRAIACFDADDDGDIDVVIANNGPDGIIYYRNVSPSTGKFLKVRLKGLGDNRFGVGARIKVSTSDGKKYMREIGSEANFSSHNSLVAHFGLASAKEVDIEILWPDGSVSKETGVTTNQTITIQATELKSRLILVNGAGSGIYDAGDEIEIRAAEGAKNYYFSHWTSTKGGEFADKYSSTTTFTMPANTVTVIANYLPGVGPDEDVSVARRWNELLLQSIRHDWARPTVHARNLFHTSAAMYDVWASYTTQEVPWLLGRTQAGYTCDWKDRPSVPRDGPEPEIPEVEADREEAMSYAAYRLIMHRFRASPDTGSIRRDAKALMSFLGYDTSIETASWESEDPAELGNYIAACYIAMGFEDGANERDDYANLHYEPVNPPLRPDDPGNPDIEDLARWQPLELQEFIDQAGNPAVELPEHLSPEWGQVWPFALRPEDLTIYTRDGYDYWVYHDPGPPPTLANTYASEYRWGFELVSIWGSHLAFDDGVMWDISPASIGNIQEYPEATDTEAYRAFYDLYDGGDTSTGYDLNPFTGEPYEEQIVPRGDYTRVLAEFWADGPDSETPPGHWFVFLNEISKHEEFERREHGTGPELDKLEWDVKAYFKLGGAMHDVAITAWGIKGYYDYIRPISAIRGMTTLGQSSDANLPSYHVNGITLIDGYIELVYTGDELAGNNDENVGKIKLKTWKGPDYIEDPDEDIAGVGWILADHWWPYQRPTFVTPPFAGYVSGHSTYSRAAAEVLTELTGSEYFPGGKSEFKIEANNFLVFERGPSVDMELQWAKYYDAADQCSLSRIWGGIHPPADDIPGRKIGIDVGKDAYQHALEYIDGTIDSD
ncbi:MAG: FG-GAP-like repeat-containing protein [Gammaproteobacteria bacterium]|nr:FG-GAP-like repeat-containing protein [Gammaproteobacteria bacterium]MDE0252311.1 FG-GAP-like repeat-containing protein [Gammaproteobacteria bacterium]MDE0402580.1 FG-GAP-like repeat-containing protein [Gammaproteobacteria bacterium]